MALIYTTAFSLRKLILNILWTGWIYFAALLHYRAPRCHRKQHVIATHNVRCQTHPTTPGTRILLSLAASTMLWLLTNKIVACFWVCGNSQYMNQWRYLERGSHLLSGHDIPHIEDIFHRANSWRHHPVASDAQGEVGFCRPDVQHFTRLPRGCCVSQSAEENIPHPSHKRAVTTQPLDLVHKDPSVGRGYAQETKFLMLYSLIPVSNMCNYTARYISPSLLFPSLLLYLLLTHLSSFGQKEMMRVLFSPGSSILTALTNRKGPLGFRTENPSWNSNSRKKVYKQRWGRGEE